MGKAKVNLAKFKVTWVQGPSGPGKGYKGGGGQNYAWNFQVMYI